MTKINRIPTALLRRADSTPADDGDVLAGNGHTARLRGIIPDADGMITVEVLHKVRPEDYGLYVRAGSVTVTMTEAEANAASASSAVYAGLGAFQQPAEAPPMAAPAVAETAPQPAVTPPTPFPPGEKGGPASTG